MSARTFSLDWFSLRDRVAIVTGGNSGLGQAFSLALATAGADIVVPSLLPDDGALAKQVAELGRRAMVMQTDLATPGAPADVVRRCIEEFGRVDVLVNSAGLCELAPVAEFGRAQWDRMLAVNLTAAFELAHAVSGPMIAQRSGKIINIASLFSYLGGRNSPAYAATKAGIVGFTRAYCDELAEHNIQVNALAPGYFATPITAATRADPEASRRISDHIPTGRWGEVEDLMGALVFLASKASDYVNGQTLVVDGGYLTR